MTVIELDKLLEEITPDAPSGKNLEYDPKFKEIERNIEGQLKKRVEGKHEIEEYKPPDWKEIRKSAIGVLSRTHDLKMAVNLTRALIHTSGLKGLYDGFSLLYGLVESFWDTLHPQLDTDDGNSPHRRLNVLLELSDYDKFIRPLRTLKLSSSPRMGQYGLRDLDIANGKISPLSEEEKAKAPKADVINAAFLDTDISVLENNRDTISATISKVDHLEILINERIGSGESVNLNALKDVLHEMAAVLDQLPVWQSKASKPDTGEENAENAVDDEMAEQLAGEKGGKEGMGMNAINHRQDVIKMLDRICAYYATNEPGSPVPLLLQRAKGLVNKNFIEIMTDMAPDSVGQLKALVGSQPDEKIS